MHDFPRFDQLLRERLLPVEILDALADTVVNGLALTEPPGPETLLELAASLRDALGAFQAALAKVLPALDRFAELAPE